MTEKELKRLSRQELLEMLVLQSKKLDRAKQSLQETEEQLAQRKLDIRESGNLAEAALRINGFFAAAQKSADDYAARAKELQDAAQERYDTLVAAANREAQRILEETSKKCQEMVGEAADKMEAHLRRIRPELWEAPEDEVVACVDEPVIMQEQPEKPNWKRFILPKAEKKPEAAVTEQPEAAEPELTEEARITEPKVEDRVPTEEPMPKAVKKTKEPKAPKETKAPREPKQKKRSGKSDSIFDMLEKRSEERKKAQE